MIIMKEKEDWWEEELISLNTRDNLEEEEWKVLARCGFMMEEDSKVNSEMTHHMEKEECF